MTSPNVIFSGPAPTWDESGELLETTGELYIAHRFWPVRLWWYPGDWHVHAEIAGDAPQDVRSAATSWASDYDRVEWFGGVHKALMDEERAAGLEAEYMHLHRALHVAEGW